LILHVDAGLAEEFGYRVGFEAGGVEGDAHGAIFFVEVDALNAIDLAHGVDGAESGLSGSGLVAEGGFEVGHGGSPGLIAKTWLGMAVCRDFFSSFPVLTLAVDLVALLFLIFFA
jgi:hypothetical protein